MIRIHTIGVVTAMADVVSSGNVNPGLVQYPNFHPVRQVLEHDGDFRLNFGSLLLPLLLVVVDVDSDVLGLAVLLEMTLDTTIRTVLCRFKEIFPRSVYCWFTKFANGSTERHGGYGTGES